MKKMYWALGSINILVILLTVHHVSAVAVMSVDFGSEWMEVGVVSPGVPMEIVLNKESKRKTPAAIAFRNEERVFGEDAINIGLRFPALSYQYLLDLLGKTVDNPVIDLYRKRFPYYQIEGDPDRNTVVFRVDNGTFSVEELVAQLLEKARAFAEESTGQTITECVLVVPGFFGQSERLALLSAANLANIKVLQLMNDYAAIALNYGIYRLKDINETAQYYIFYDMGAYKTSAAVVSYQLVKDKATRETNPVIHVLGVGYDRTLGGLEMQLRLRNYLAEEFNKMKKTTTDVFSNPRALAKLFKEAGRVKNVLSANTHHFAQIEGLLDEKDFKFEVTREKFEELTADLYERVTAPLDRALAASGLTLNVINQVIIFGGATRVPKVQDVLKNAIKQDLGKNINMDEAATLGAVYRAADLANGFKVKKIIVKDAVLFPIQVTFDREGESGNIRQVKRALFGAMNPYPQKKVITFNKHTDDFQFNVNYADLDHLETAEVANLGSLNLTQISLSGVAKVLEANTGENMDSKGIKAHFVLNESGLFELTGVDLVIEKTVKDEPEESTLSKLGSTITKLFTGDDGTKTEKKEDSKSHEAETEDEADQEDDKDKRENEKEREKSSKEDERKREKSRERSKEKSKEKSKEEKRTKDGDGKNETSVDGTPVNATEIKPKIVIIKEPIENEIKLLFTAPLLGDRFNEAQKKLQELKEHERLIARRQTALNALESFVIEANQRLDETEYSSCATEKEAEDVRAACAAVSDWLYEDGEDADADTYEAKLKELSKMTNAIYARHWEHSERPDAVKTLNKLIESASAFLETARNLTKEVDPDKDVFTTVEIALLEKTIQDAIEWRDKEIAAQEKLKRHEAVRLTIKLLADRMNIIDREVKYLVTKLKIWRPKVKETTKKNETTEEAGAGNDTTKIPDKIKLDFNILNGTRNETDLDDDVPLTAQEQLDFPELFADLIAAAIANQTAKEAAANGTETTTETPLHVEL